MRGAAFPVANRFGCRFNTTEAIGVWWILAAIVMLVRKIPLASAEAGPPARGGRSGLP
jgi:hypothetical protein